MKTKTILSVILFAMMTAVLPASGQQSAQPPQYRQEATPVLAHQVSPHVYEVRGGDGANCSLIVGEKEAFLIDAKMTAKSAKEMTAAIKKITGKPISRIILTHSDGDHVNGLPGISGTTDILAHINTAKHIEQANESGTEKVPLPNEIFDSRMSVFSEKFRIDLLYFGPAHTDGDIVILVPDDKIAIVGDLFFKGQDPLIHMNKNGNSFGLVNVLGRIAELDAQTFLSGHTEPVAKAEVEELRRSIIEKQNRVKAMVEEDKTLDEIKKALGVSTEQSRWRSLAEVIYLELTGENQK